LERQIKKHVLEDRVINLVEKQKKELKKAV
jgi:hypothetical protein